MNALILWARQQHQQHAVAVVSAVAEAVAVANSKAQRMILDMLSQFEIRFGPFDTWPYLITHAVDPRIPMEQKADPWKESACCLDDEFTGKLVGLSPSFAALLGDRELLNGISDWAIETPLGNMGLERLLALFKKSCPEKFPLFERLRATSLLTQALREHLKAGGADPRQTSTREELTQLGVPLECLERCKSSRQSASQARGLFTYVNTHLQPGHLPQDQRYDELRRLSSEFASLSPEERRVWRDDERADKVCQPSKDGADWDEEYFRIIGNTLWGSSSRNECLSESSFVEQIRLFLQERGVRDIGGMRQYSLQMRDDFAEGALLRDQFDISPDVEVGLRLPCGVAHPGLCPRQMASIYHKALRCADNLTQWVSKLAKKGDIILLRADNDCDQLLLVSKIRLRDPNVVYFVYADRCFDMLEDRPVVRLRLPAHGRLRPQVATQVAACLLGEENGVMRDSDVIVASKVVAKRRADTLETIDLLDTPAGDERFRQNLLSDNFKISVPRVAPGPSAPAKGISKGFKRMAFGLAERMKSKSGSKRKTLSKVKVSLTCGNY